MRAAGAQPEKERLHHAQPLEYAQSRFRGGAVQITDNMTLSAGMSVTTQTPVYDIREGRVNFNSRCRAQATTRWVVYSIGMAE